MDKLTQGDEGAAEEGRRDGPPQEVRVAGVRLDDGSTVWVEAKYISLTTGCRVTVQLRNGELSGWVFVTPEQLLQRPEHVDGIVVEAFEPEDEQLECRDLPGEGLPCLGTRVETETLAGTVVAIDVVNRQATLSSEDGVEVTVPADELLVRTQSLEQHAGFDGGTS